MNAAASLQPYADTKPKERQPYRLGAVIQELRDQARDTDAHLEGAITELYLALEDGKVDEHEAYAVLRSLIHAYKTNSNQLNALNLLDESGSEPALREVERIQSKRRKGMKS
jgi:hypothetical protein